MNKRQRHIDIAKGISILAVALFHNAIADFFPKFVSLLGLIRIPFFFFLAGIFFSTRRNAKDFILHKADTLLKPYFVSLFAVLLYYILTASPNISKQILGMIYSNGSTIRIEPLWFLPHLFLLFTVCYLTLRTWDFNKRSTPFKIGLVFSLIGIGVIVKHLFWQTSFFGSPLLLPGLPFSADILPLSAAFFLSGYFLKSVVLNFRPSIGLSIFALTGFIVITTFTNAKIDFNLRVFNPPLFSLLGAICGIYLALLTSYFIKFMPFISTPLIKIGQSSLFILIFHAHLGDAVFSALIYFFGEHLQWVLALIAFAVSIFIPMALKVLAARIPPLSLLLLPSYKKQPTSLSLNTFRTGKPTL